MAEAGASQPARWGLGVATVVAVLVGGAWVAGNIVASENLPRNATIGGVSVGGLAPKVATRHLADALAERAAGDLTVRAGGESITVTPAEAGLSLDAAASVARAGGGPSWNPAVIVAVLFGGTETPPVVAVDRPLLDAAVAALAERVDRAPVDATVTYQGLDPVRTEGTSGTALDRSATADAIVAAYLRDTEVAAPVAPQEPEITTAEADAVVAGVARTAVSAPIRVAVGDKGDLELSPKAVATALEFEPGGGNLEPVFHRGRLARELAGPLQRLGLKQPKDATIAIGKGKPRIVESVDGLGVDATALGEVLTPVLSRPAPRTAAVDVSPLAASFTTADAEALKVKKVIGSFTTSFPGSAYRYNNIGKAARLVNGTLLKPGEVFSMNAVLGKRTRAAGWMSGGAIDGGRIVERLGGGISQATTTTFNAIFFAGLEDIYHKPHSLYFDRYPVGREATLDWESVDLKFRNDSPYGVLLQAWTTGRTGATGTVTVRVWSTRRYTIKASSPVRSNYRAPGRTIYDKSPGCIPQGAISGFDVKYFRLFYEGKKLVKREPFRWSYNSLTPVVCGRKPAD